MANGHGGYRKPTNPAPVSGPGAHSRRTDGQPSMQLSNPNYGDQQDFQQIQQGAKMASQPQPQISMQDLASGAGGGPQITPLSAPSQQPDTPVTDGSQYGPGQGPSALNIQDPSNMDANSLGKYLPALIEIADDPSTPPGYRSWVRNIIASQSR